MLPACSQRPQRFRGETRAKDFVESDVEALDIHGSMLHAGEFQEARKAGPSHLRKFMSGFLAGVDCCGLLRKNARALKYSLRGSSPRPMAHKTIALTTELRELALNGGKVWTALFLSTGTWCSGITSASHAEGPGFNPQCVHFSFWRSEGVGLKLD